MNTIYRSSIRLAMIACLAQVIFLPRICAAEPVRVKSSDRIAALQVITNKYSGAASARERAEQCFSLLKQEMKLPSTAGMGSAGGPIDTGYVQNVIIGSFLYSNAPNVGEQERLEVREWAKDALKREGEADKELHDRLILLIGHTGDKSVVGELVTILQNHPEGYMRYEAAMALFDTKDPASVPALKHALETDTYARVRTGGSLEPNVGAIVYSPVRQAAARALKHLGLSVPEEADIVDAKNVVPQLEKMLYSNDAPFRELMFLAGVGGPDAEDAVNRFIAKTASSSLADFARDALERAKTGRAIN